MPERFKPFLDCNQLVREREVLFPVAFLLAEDRVKMDVRYGIDNYPDRANDVQLDHRTPQMSLFAESRGSIEALEFWSSGRFIDRLAGC